MRMLIPSYTFVPNIKIIGAVVPEKFLMEKKKLTHTQTNIVTEKTKTIYPLYNYYESYVTKL